MSLDHVLHLVDEFARAMRDQAKQPGSITADDLNQQRERVHEAIRELAGLKTPGEVAAARVAREAITAAAAPPQAPPGSTTTLTDGSAVTPDHREIDPATGLQKAYVVLSAEERAKGFIRPVRRSYVHKKCGAVTTMGQALAETYARDPAFYNGTFCVGCRAHYPVGADGEFTWDGTTEKVGT